MIRDAPTIIADLCQSHSAKKRKHDIPQFTKALRREDRFQAIWEDVGGASGLASLMAEFSIRDLRELCNRLGMTASAQQVQSQRRAALGELVEILYQRRGREDSRPVDRFYQHIIPACNLEVVQRFEQEQKIKCTIAEERVLLAGHPQLSESKLLQEAFSKDDLLFAHYQSLLRGNIHFTRSILTTFLAKDKVNCHPDLLDEVAMPLLKTLRKSRYDNETRSQHLDLVLQCIRKHHLKMAQFIAPPPAMILSPRGPYDHLSCCDRCLAVLNWWALLNEGLVSGCPDYTEESVAFIV